MRKYIPRVPPSYDKEFPDFALREVAYFEEGAVRRFKLLLPVTEQVDQLLRRCAADARSQEAELAEERARKIDEERAARSASKPEPSPFISPRKKDTDQYGVIDARAELRLQYDLQREQADCRDHHGLMQLLAEDSAGTLLLPGLRPVASSPEKNVRLVRLLFSDMASFAAVFRAEAEAQRGSSANSLMGIKFVDELKDREAVYGFASSAKSLFRLGLQDVL